MKSRSQCSCSCHAFGAVHMTQCCQPDRSTCHYCGVRIWWDTTAVDQTGYVGVWRSEEDDCDMCPNVPTDTHGQYLHLPLEA